MSLTNSLSFPHTKTAQTLSCLRVCLPYFARWMLLLFLDDLLFRVFGLILANTWILNCGNRSTWLSADPQREQMKSMNPMQKLRVDICLTRSIKIDDSPLGNETDHKFRMITWLIPATTTNAWITTSRYRPIALSTSGYLSFKLASSK